MKKSPLQLEKSFFIRTSVEARPQPDKDATWQVETKHRANKAEGDSRQWFISLDVTIVPSEPKLSLPYSIVCEIFGQFRVDPAWDESKVEQLVVVNGCSVLYASVREMIYTITARGPWGPLLLPTGSFVGDYQPNAAPTRKIESAKG